MRHGENIWPTMEAITCDGYITDLGLTPEGEEQIHILVSDSTGILSSVKTIYSSTTLRTLETAKIMANRLGVCVIPIDDLRSVDLPLGPLAIETAQRFKKAEKPWYDMWLPGDWGYEDFYSFIDRVDVTLKIISNNQLFNTGPNSILLVCHEEIFWAIEVIRRLNVSPNLDKLETMRSVASEFTIPYATIIELEI